MPSKAAQAKPALLRRSPVVVVMGHIDHGKSTLLDYIRKANVVAGEAGGITQHMGAYEAEHVSADGKKHTITFIDTPGHEAFGSIRERGARVADIAILVVSAEDGVKPQTIEAFKTIKESGIPFVVAINKIDKPNADIDKTKTSLGEHEIYVEGWGGDVPFAPISALKGTGVSELLDLIMLVAELADLTADPSAPASGMVIESELDMRKGISATLLIKNGTLSVGSYVVAGSSFVPVRFIENFKGEQVKSAGPSSPARIIGWNATPSVGTVFETISDKKEAVAIAAERALAERQKKMQPKTAEQHAQASADEQSGTVFIPVIIKADVIGSLEGVKYELSKIKHDRVKLKIVSEGIGEIGENDIKVAMGDPSIIIVGFNAAPDKKAEAMIQRSPVPLNVRSFKIIYELSEYVRAALTEKIPKVYEEEMTGRAKILALFSHEKDRQVVGGKVESGTIGSGNAVRIMRREAEIGRGFIRELQEKKVRTREVAEGHEFGMMVEAKIEMAPGDRIEAVRTVEKI